MEPKVIDLNADLGEWTGDMPEAERALLGVVTTAHVACGAHAGDAASMDRTVAVAAELGVVVGAHPSYPDPEGFGRRAMDLSADDAAASVLSQVEALREVARAHGVAVRSVKPHGALYHRLSADAACAGAVARALFSLRADLVAVVPAGAATRAVFEGEGVRTVAEGFCDRAYRRDGSLVARSEPGALLTDPAAAARQALAIALDGAAVAVDGSPVPVACESLCVHGDTPGAGAIAVAVRTALGAQGVALAPFAPPARAGARARRAARGEQS